jgi:hypothetical protein
VATAALLTVGSAGASATTALRVDPPGGLLTGTTTIKNTTSDPAVFQTQAGTFTCSRTNFDVDVTSNSSAGSISGSLTALTFTSCTDTILAVNISACHLHRVGGIIPSVSITSTAGGGNVLLNDVTIRCTTSPTQGCYFTAASANGTAANATSRINFPSVAVSVASPAGTTDAVSPAFCGTTAALGFTLTHIVDAANRTVTITTS